MSCVTVDNSSFVLDASNARCANRAFIGVLQCKQAPSARNLDILIAK